MDKKTILVVDDEQVMLETFKMIYSERFNILTAISVEEGKLFISTKAVDFIICDFNLLDGTATEIIKHAKLNGDIPVVIMSGSNHCLDSRVAGAVFFVTKINLEHLDTIIDVYLNPVVK